MHSIKNYLSVFKQRDDELNLYAENLTSNLELERVCSHGSIKSLSRFCSTGEIHQNDDALILELLRLRLLDIFAYVHDEGAAPNPVPRSEIPVVSKLVSYKHFVSGLD